MRPEAPPFPGSSWRAGLRLLLWLLFSLAMVAIQIVLRPLGRRLSRAIAGFYYRSVRRLLGIAIARRGAAAAAAPALFVSNHASYLDILILGALLDGRFVAKAEIARWPLVGPLSRLQGTVFVARRREDAGRERDDMQRILAGGESLILFPEGTSNDGNGVLPFRSALFGVAERRAGGGALPVQPISIAYTRLDGVPLGRDLRPHLAWYGDMDLGPHFWDFLRLGRIEVAVTFHTVVSIDDFASRKALARHCENVIRQGVETSLAGQDQA